MSTQENSKQPGLEKPSSKRSPDILQHDLERLVKDGHRTLKSLATQLNRMGTLNILGDSGRVILDKIQKSREFNASSKSVIAFIGESGVGKSTLLNALVSYDNIVPTSGMRACTSCATEFSQRTPEMKAAFTAVIEYTTLEEAKEEMSILCEDIQDEALAQNGSLEEEEEEEDGDDGAINSQAFKRDSRMDVSATDAYKSALSKLIALLPGFTDKEVSTSAGKLESLYKTSQWLQEDKKILESDDEDSFVKEIHQLISGLGDGSSNEPRLWPLIKVVKIYLDAPVLETGAVLVDLPGLQDNNPARTSVAKNYLQKADKIIIVARLNRILTNDTATALARMGYAKQMEFDGRKSITIVGTCCDQFDANDAQNEFAAIDGFSETYTELEGKAKKPRQQELQTLKPNERKLRMEEYKAAKRQLEDFCDSFRDRYVTACVTETYSKLLGEGTEIKCFLVAAKQYQDLNPDSEDILWEKTQIPQLREYCIRVAVGRNAHQVKNFISFDVLGRTSEARILVEDLGSLSEQIRNCICAELEKATLNMKEALDSLETACDRRISKCREKIMEEIVNLSNESITHCRKILQGCPKSFRLPTYRAICCRGGTWNRAEQPAKHLNQRFLDSMEDGLQKLWKHCWVGIEESLSVFTASVVMLLGGFKSDWTKIIDRECPNPTPEIKESRKAFLSV
ncbi:hypothetical protein TWF481_003823 [Arthrobotrys musiformis]|uniref:Dynamin N-terminal domain-containing protein n=1 Tax=Arthrobotrys musiformis TaxID=47236 RepID=A0AAV9WHQ0_9PEZI